MNGTITSFTYDRNRLLTTSSGGTSASYSLTVNVEHVTAAVTAAVSVSRELDEDYVGAWVVVWHVRRLLPDASDVQARRLSESIFRGLIADGVVIGDLSGKTGEFTPWCAEDGVEDVMRQWCQLGRYPNIGDIAWLMRP